VCRPPGWQPEYDADVTPAIDASPETPDADPAVAPWWDPAWPYRRHVFVHNPGGDPLPAGTQIPIEIDVDNVLGVGLPRHGIRIMHWAPGGDWYQVARVIDDTPALDEHIWFALDGDTVSPSDTLDHYWIYYGHESPPTDQLDDPNDVFEEHHAFGSLDSSVATKGAVTVTGGELQLDYDEHLGTVSTWGPDHAVDFALRVPVHTARYWGGFQTTAADFADNQPWIIWIARDSVAELWPELFVADIGMSSEWVGGRKSIDTETHIYGVDRFAGRIVYRFDNDVHGEFIPLETYTDELPARLTCEADQPIYFDFLRIRRTHFPLPEVTVGPEEAQ
jgi:hypothetical protein